MRKMKDTLEFMAICLFVLFASCVESLVDVALKAFGL